MARARNIKPGLFKNEILGVADPLFTLLFQGLWLLADRAGRLEDRPLRIKAEVFPYREGISVDDMLNWLQTNGFIVRYQVKDLRAIQIINFEKHQNPHVREVPSEIPAEHSQGDDEAQPRQCSEPDPAQPCTEPARLIPSSLIPDSLSSDSDAPAVASRAAPRPSRKCPDSFEPADPEAFIAEHAPGVDWRVETAKFRDHTFKAAISDWSGAWRNWMRRAVDMAPKAGPPSAMTFREREIAVATARVHEMTGGLVSAKPAGHRADALQEVFDAAPRRLG